MDKLLTKKIKEVFNKYSKIKLAYLFGSRARGDEGPRSDYDFAVYLEEKDSNKRFDLKLTLMVDISRIVKNDNVDIVVLNDDISPLLKYLIIKEGVLLKEVEPYKVIVEPRILNEHFDFKLMYEKAFK